MSLADTLADQLGHVRIQRDRLSVIEAHLLSAIDVAHDLESGTESSTATLPGPPPSPGAAVAVDTTHRTQQDISPQPVSLADANRLTSVSRPDADSIAETSEEINRAVNHQPKPPPAAMKPSNCDLAQVATIAREAIESGISPKKHVHAKLAACPTEAMAATLIAQARKHGHDIPLLRAPRTANPAAASRTAPRSSPEAQVPGKRFECSTCDHTALTVRDIVRHTRSTHNRDAFASEKMPT